MQPSSQSARSAGAARRECGRRSFGRPLLVPLAVLGALFANAQPAGPAGPAREAAFLNQVRQLTYEGRRAGEGYFGADGRTMVFQSEREPGNPFFQIYHLDLTSGDSVRITPGTGKATCGFLRPGGREVLFASTHLDPEAEAKQQAEIEFRASGQSRRYSWDYDPHMDIFVAAPDGSQRRRLTNSEGYDAEGAYSPDGTKIVFTSLRGGYPSNVLNAEDRQRLEVDPAYFGEIYIMNADGTDQRRLTHSPGYDGGPFFSADGQRIIWRRFSEDSATADVHTMRIDGSDVRRLTDFESISWAPYLHPSGEYAIFSSNKHGFANFELFLVDALGERTPARVTFTEGFDGLPTFSPDGRRISWTSSRTADGSSQLFLADWNHDGALAALAAAPARAATTDDQAAAADDTRLRRMVEFLASDALEGRMTGSPGAKRAAEYIAERLQGLGLAPVGADGFFHGFHFTAGMAPIAAKTSLATADRTFEDETNFRPLSFSADGEVEGEVVFAGYGLAVPGGLGEGYDSFANLDLTDKIALVLRYAPEAVEPQRRQVLNRYAGLRYKALLARERGAKAVLVATGPNSPGAGALAPMRFDNSMADSGILAMSVDMAVAEHLFAAAGKDLATVQANLDKEMPHAEGGFPLGVTATVSVGVERVKKPDRNVVALLPATPPPEGAPPAPNEYVLVGAHYDHIGRGAVGSLADKDEQGEIHNGADDNASGTAVVLRLAELLAKREVRRRGVVFAFWSGEELGLVGSSRFVANPAVPLADIAAYVNFDMVGRLRDNQLIVQGVGSSSVWRRLLERRNIPAGFQLTLQDDPYLPTDSTAFYPKNVPVLSFFTGSHTDYNRPTDDADTLNYHGMARIARLAAAVVGDLASLDSRPDYVTVERGAAGQGGRDSLRAYLGTIPDYATEGGGVRLSGVRGGGPADLAGLRGGDVIVEFAGQTIANIYDYTYALDAVRIGEPVDVVVLRDGERMAFRVTPKGRE